MLTTSYAPASAPCRRAIVPACDPQHETQGSIPPSVDGNLIKIKKGDIIDVGLDWSGWLAANTAEIVSSEWAKHAASPQEPVFQGDQDLFNEVKGHSVVVLDLSGATVGQTYYLENTVVVSGKDGGFTLPNRTIKRVIHIRVVL